MPKKQQRIRITFLYVQAATAKLGSSERVNTPRNFSVYQLEGRAMLAAIPGAGRVGQREEAKVRLVPCVIPRSRKKE